MKLLKRLLIVASMLGAFIALWFVFQAPTQVTDAATVAPPTTSSTVQSNSTIEPKAELTVNGLTGSDAKITDMNGVLIQPSDNLYSWLNFNVSYNWSIPDNVKIESGDTIPFELPSGIVSSGDLSFPIYDSNGVEIGNATIKNGEAKGVITFNDVLSETTIDRHGTLSFIAKGTNNGNGNQGQNWMFNKNGWVSGYDPTTGIPDQLTWNIAFNPNLHNLTNVVITDTLGPNEEYIPGSLTAIAGSYGPGGFESNGHQLTPEVTTNGNQVIISFPGNITTAVDIYYRVKVTGTSASGTTTWTNHATMASSEGNQQVDTETSWGGSGTGTGGQKVGSMTFTKTDGVSGALLAGAEYELKDSKGKVLISNAMTDQNGKIVLTNLPYGDYTLTEVKAPNGYILDSTPISFTISDSSVDITSTQKDQAEAGAVVLKKIDPDTKDSISGATFNLLDQNGKLVKEGLVTNDNGEIAVSDLPAGIYQFVETQPAAGYDLNTTPIEFTVVAGQTTPVELEKFNVATTVVPNTGNVVLTKVDATLNKLLPGAIFELLDGNGKVIETGLTTNANGQITVTDLEAGNYSFVEIAAPEGYELDKTPINFTVSKDIVSDLEAKDQPKPTEPNPPVEPNEPGPPVEPTEPPVKPTEPQPGKPEPPVEPTVPQPGKPNPPVEPTVPQPGKPNPPVKPTVPQPGKPNPPVKPIVPQPGKPELPTEPSKPISPTEPGNLIPPVNPEASGDEPVPETVGVLPQVNGSASNSTSNSALESSHRLVTQMV
ncbi:SpaA isopeptide-forming pilin-related protein [Companilactobacillus sp. FL22-1]|uniref:SpaA isopeptide-forming pilin-related protein n=1 Tax=Companilactobacillus sp. FL22-1 TaxID=3373892 RepID=UPI0037543407